MKTLSRRAVCSALAALASMGGGWIANAQTPCGSPAVLAESRVFLPEQMPSRKMANGAESRDVTHGALSTGEVVGVHESEQPPATPPNSPHTIQHSEFIMVREGTVAFEHDGKVEKVGTGGVIFVAPRTLHTLRNVGQGPAKYFVVQIGGDTKK